MFISKVLWLTVTYTVVHGMNKLCYQDYPELSGLLCYKECRSGYKGAGPVCWAHCPPRTTDIGALCVKKTNGRGAGKTLRYCPKGNQKNGLLCYPNCKSGYGGAGPVCWQRCKSGYKDDGITCRRDVHATSRDVGDCPWYDKCGLCGGPWYNVCGRRRKCGGSCPAGYRNDGCTCWRDAHIYGKKSYGRGVGSPMVCGQHEEQQGLLCYDKCASGYKGVGPVCWATCSGNTIDTGTQCQKKSYGRGVGKAVNCLKTPSCNDINNCEGLASEFAKLGPLKTIQAGVCQNLYARVLPWLTVLKTFNSCYKNSEWGTLSIAYSLGAAVGVTATSEIGVAIDVDNNKGICYVGGCLGFKSDVSIGAELVMGWWKSLDSIAGESKTVSAGVDIPTTEIGVGAGFVTAKPSGEYIGTTFSLGLGVGLSPVDIATLDCDTPSDKVVQFNT